MFDFRANRPGRLPSPHPSLYPSPLKTSPSLSLSPSPADTLAHEGAVVVQLLHADAALGAVDRPRRPLDLAAPANRCSVTPASPSPSSCSSYDNTTPDLERKRRPKQKQQWGRNKGRFIDLQKHWHDFRRFRRTPVQLKEGPIVTFF